MCIRDRSYASGTPPDMRDLGPRPPPVSPLEGVKENFSTAIFSVTATDSATILSASGATLRSLISAPNDRGPYPKIWHQGPLTKNSLFSTLRFFGGREINETFRDCRHCGLHGMVTSLNHADVTFRC